MKPFKISAHSDKHSDNVLLLGIREYELKFCEVSRNNKSKRCWKFQISIWTNKKVVFLKKILSVPCTMDSSFFSQQMAPWHPNFTHQRLWPYHLLIIPGDLPRGCNFKSWEYFFFTYSILERSDRLYPSLQVMLSKQIICIGTSLIVLIFTLDYDLIKAKSSEIILFFFFLLS